MTDIRVLIFTRFFVSNQRPDIQSKIFDECISLSKKIKLIVVAQKIRYEQNENLSLVKIRIINRPIIDSLCKLFGYSIAALQKRDEYDIVFPRMLNIYFLMAGLIVKILFKKKLVVWVSGTAKVRKKFRNAITRKIVKIAISHASTIITSSNNVVSDLETNIGKIDSTKVYIIRQEINTNFFKPKKILSSESIILSVTRSDRIKRIEDQITAISYVKDKIPNVRLVIIGPFDDKEYLNQLMELATNLHCEKFVEFLGPLSPNKLVNWYNQSKIFILTSQAEGASLVTLEAMSCGKVVISTPVGAIPDVIINGVNGFLIKHDDSKMLATKIISLLQDDHLREKVGIEARKTIEEKYSKGTFINELMKVFAKYY